ncbi:aspartate-alanine antiporter [Bdellovibrio svalbardensis]|uniref:Aspartate-alanine antiporter n=1 Tax=Bdellovibrio svalbardensis TaxID=2972972 RepID=A0ABT6DNP5_9BACT|nr:aspartate-alanine antiporter [Bdellovibrio svalbardensis]MDG0818271.1 aspartate-alanine antiporter [Bdellovibrio svalbardensis]
MNWLFTQLKAHPELAFFLTIGVGYLIGKIKIGYFQLGSVTGTLLTGVLVGQLGIAIGADTKAIFFLMFLFAVGYKVGPQFIQGLKKDGLPQVFFAIFVCVGGLAVAYIAAKVMGYDLGYATGLLAGALTQSAVIGVGQDTINSLPDLSAELKTQYNNSIPIAYAVTYIMGTVVFAWFFSSFGPKILGIDLAKECKDYEAKLGAKMDDPGVMPAMQMNALRTYKITNGKFANRKVAELESSFAPTAAFVTRMRHEGKVIDPNGNVVIVPGDIVVVGSKSKDLVEHEKEIGEEVYDPELMDFKIEFLDVVMTNKEFLGKTLGDIVQEKGHDFRRNVMVRKITRIGHELPIQANLTIQAGDVLTLVGKLEDVERVAKTVGTPDRRTDMSDMVFVGLGILLGGLVGLLSFKVSNIPLSLSTSGGALISGLLLSYWRATRPTFGAIPAAGLWIMDSMGLCAFVAIVGLISGPGFIAGIKAVGISLLFVGIAVTFFTCAIAVLGGRYLFKFHPAILFGACAGSMTTTAALGAIQENAKSKVPVLGYTITYAVANTIKTIWGAVIVFLLV